MIIRYICAQGSFCNEISMHFLQSFMRHVLFVFLQSSASCCSFIVAENWLYAGVSSGSILYWAFALKYLCTFCIGRVFFFVAAVCSDILGTSFALIKHCISAQLSRGISTTWSLRFVSCRWLYIYQQRSFLVREEKAAAFFRRMHGDIHSFNNGN